MMPLPFLPEFEIFEMESVFCLFFLRIRSDYATMVIVMLQQAGDDRSCYLLPLRVVCRI